MSLVHARLQDHPRPCGQAQGRRGGPRRATAEGGGRKALASVTDDRGLSEMGRRIFAAGFVWNVIETKWPGFEAAFLGFEPKRLAVPAGRVLGRLLADTRIVRNPQKIQAVRDNARFVDDIAERARQLRHVPRPVAGRRSGRSAGPARQARRRLGGTHRPVFPTLDRLRHLHRVDRHGRVPARCRARHRREPDLEEGPQRKIQEQMNAWAGGTGLPYAPLAHLRHVDRRELRRRDVALARRRSGLGRFMSWSLSLLFVCQGNTCRSPMAAAIAKQRWPGCRIQSAGIAVASEGQGAAREAVAAMRSRGIDISAHTTTSIGSLDWQSFDGIRRTGPHGGRIPRRGGRRPLQGEEGLRHRSHRWRRARVRGLRARYRGQARCADVLGPLRLRPHPSVCAPLRALSCESARAGIFTRCSRNAGRLCTL